MSESHQPMIDRQALDRHTMGNTELQRELFMLFFDQAPVYIDQLQEAVLSGDRATWHQAAHGIKGAARALGFVRLAVLARECEETAPDADKLDLLRETVEMTRADLQRGDEAA